MYSFAPYNQQLMQPMMATQAGWQMGMGYQGNAIGQEVVRQVILTAWNNGQRSEEILSDCADFLSRSEMAFAELLVEELERNYQPTEVEVQAYLQKIRKVFRTTRSSQALQRLADSTINLHLKQKALKAVEALRAVEISGRSLGGDKKLDLANVVEQVLAEQLSMLIFGNSGSGKSSVAKLVVSELSYSPNLTGGKQPEILILDHHINDWGNFPLVYKQEDVLRCLHLYCLELKRRQLEWAWQVENLPARERNKNWPYIVMGWDEVGGTIAFANSAQGKELIGDESLTHPSDALLILGSELRKFMGCLIAMPHSQNVEALGIDSNYRDNFLRVDLCKSAVKQAQMWNSDSLEYKFIMARKKGYPCVVNGVPALHPSHYQYDVFRNNQPPAEIRPPKLSPLSLTLPCQPIAYEGSIHETFIGEVKSMWQITSYYEQLFSKYETKDKKSDQTQVYVQNSLNKISDIQDEEDDLYQLFLDIKKYRSQSTPLNKTQICAQWTGKTERKHKQYDEVLKRYAKDWVEEWLEENELQPSNYKDLIELIWDKTPNRRKREEFQQCRAQLGEILRELGLTIPWSQGQVDSEENNVVPLKARG